MYRHLTGNNRGRLVQKFVEDDHVKVGTNIQFVSKKVDGCSVDQSRIRKLNYHNLLIVTCTVTFFIFLGHC